MNLIKELSHLGKNYLRGIKMKGMEGELLLMLFLTFMLGVFVGVRATQAGWLV